MRFGKYCALLAVLALTALTGEAVAAGEAIKIGVYLPLTGTECLWRSTGA